MTLKQYIIDALRKYSIKLNSIFVSKDSVVDNLISTSQTLPLSANQGKKIMDDLNNIETSLSCVSFYTIEIPSYTSKVFTCTDAVGYIFYNPVYENGSSNPYTIYKLYYKQNIVGQTVQYYLLKGVNESDIIIISSQDNRCSIYNKTVYPAQVLFVLLSGEVSSVS